MSVLQVRAVVSNIQSTLAQGGNVAVAQRIAGVRMAHEDRVRLRLRLCSFRSPLSHAAPRVPTFKHGGCSLGGMSLPAKLLCAPLRLPRVGGSAERLESDGLLLPRLSQIRVKL